MKKLFEKTFIKGRLFAFLLLFIMAVGCSYSDTVSEGGDATLDRALIEATYDFAVVTSASTKELSLSQDELQERNIDEDGCYSSKEDVAYYIHIYGRLPGNFITKKQAKALGWTGGSLEEYAPSKCIGGDYFGNYEGLLPEEEGREYRECDIDTLGAKKRGAKRIIYSNDGLIYYTEDHYESFELLYGQE